MKIYIEGFKLIWGQSWRRARKCDWLSVRPSLEEMKYLFKYICNYFHFLHSGVQAKRDVEFRHLTRNACKLRRKVGNRVSYY